ncbi:MAG: hypothetical protein COA86_10475 [Kangiella sp.]|nr:MAG: hypothetical protein COA86_10475 [Kangiella sp.]
MQITDNKKQLKRRSQSSEVLGSKVRLVNRFSLIGLTIISVVALWLVSPSRTMLLNLLAESSSPDVALAFLYALDKSVQDDEDIKYLMFKNHLILNNLIKAEAIILPLLKDINGKRNWKAFEKYLNLLLVQYSVAQTNEEKEKKLKEIKSLFDKIDSISDPNIVRVFADSALAMGFVEKAYQYLLTYRHNLAITNEKELLRLTLQFSDYSAALMHQQKIFDKHQTISQFKKLLSLYDSANQRKEAYLFIREYDLNASNNQRRKKIVSSNEFIVLSVEQALLQNDDEFARSQVEKIIERPISEIFLSRIVKASISQNDLQLAVITSERRALLYPTQKNIAQAHDIAIWHGDIFRALELTHLRVANSPSEVNIRQAIKESIALGDYSSQGKYYRMLASHHFLTRSEYDDFIKIIELTEGSRIAIIVVNDLLQSEINIGSALGFFAKDRRKKLLLHKARLHSYFSEFDIINDIWLTLSAFENKGLIAEITSNESDLFAKTKISLNQSEEALDILLRREDWLEEYLVYLQTVFSIAWKIGNKKIAINALDELTTRSGYDSSSALNGYRYIQLHQPFIEDDIPRLLELSELWNNERLLLIAIDLAYNNKNYKLLDHLLAKVMQNSSNRNNERLIFYTALSAIKQGKTDKVKILFSQLLKNTPKDESIINSYLWWLIDQNELELLDNIYNRYKFELKDKMEFWLVFSAASQKLNSYSEAEHWLRKLLVENIDVSVNAILDYAQLMEVKGDRDTAFRLRQYVVNNLSQELFDLEPEHYSFFAMVKIFAGERFSLPLLEQQVVGSADKRGTIDLFSYYLQRQDYQRLLLFKNDKQFSHFKLPDWQRLSIALLERDKKSIVDLVKNSLQLPIAQKNHAMQKLGGTAFEGWADAWSHGELMIGNIDDERVEKELRHVHISQHSTKSHGFQVDYSSFTHWNISRLSARYFQPIDKGWWGLTLMQQSADTPLLIQGNIIENEVRALFDLNLKIDWFKPYLEQAQPEILSIKLDLAEGLGSFRSGVHFGLSRNIDDRLQSYYSLGINQAFEVSEFATLVAKNDQLSFGLNYFPTNRESFSFKLNLNNVKTRFGDKVATGWDYSLRLSEKLFSSDPGWNIYLDFVQQEYKLKDEPLIEINDFFAPANQIEANDFVDEKFSRFAIGQRLFNGAPAQPGALKSSPSYWFDTSIGLNTRNNQADFSLSSGIGWRLFGDDELSAKVDWQSNDINGDKAFKFSFSYYYNL